ncbi:PH domain-containing protein [Actinomadura madurae]|uniref:PH domain-containing protein n=1 Tax=Actinomadura madurae TaxID=1993 RepID=UPI0015EF43CB|nr:PH domain-containing protein [Actinomadura madurae]MCP9965365.1 PH domain-containing protein [Actinomadura madurae]MCP9977852.1 PH domain-containing protein [Actinomadura madurae]MCQ0010649.1 PH domain-containing protein [Actinomadura madurae]
MEASPERRWRVPPGHVAVKCAAAAAVTALVVLYSHDPQFLFLAGAAAIGLNALALRDLVAPVRLAADGDGLTVASGYAGRRRVRWDEVTAIRVDERRRLLLHTRMLEVETADDLHLLSAFDLGADVHDVADELYRLRARTGR